MAKAIFGENDLPPLAFPENPASRFFSGTPLAPLALRKQVVEPVFGQIKQARGFRQFLLRGVENVRAEWSIVCSAHNLTKLFQATVAS